MTRDTDPIVRLGQGDYAREFLPDRDRPGQLIDTRAPARRRRKTTRGRLQFLVGLKRRLRALRRTAA